MITLTIRTDKPEAEIGLFKDGKQLSYEKWEAHRQLAETIHQKLQNLLSVKTLAFHDIDAVVFYKGPGSFTGLRIGASVANALAYGLNVPIIGTGGEDWIQVGINSLREGHDEKSVTPEYGSPIHITKPKH